MTPLARKGPHGLPYRPCAGVVLVNADGLVFAGQRLDNPDGAWQMPQGGIDPGETVTQAALRELGEETGLPNTSVQVRAETHDWLYYDLPENLLGKLWQGQFGGQCQKWVLMQFTGTDEQVNIHTEHPEFGQWRWVKAGDLLDLIVPFKRDVYESVITEFRPHLA